MAGAWRLAGRLIGHLVRCGWDLGSSLPTPSGHLTAWIRHGEDDDAVSVV